MDGGCSCGCGGISSYDTLRRVLPEPGAQAAVRAAAGSVLAVDSPAILVAARSPWDLWGTGNYSSRSLHTSIRIGFHIFLFYCTHRCDPDGVCRGQLGEVLQGVRGEGGDADRGGEQLEID